MNEQQQQENQLQVFIKGLDVLKTAPEVLTSNEAIVEKVLIAGNFLLTQVEDNGGVLNDELDETAKEYIKKSAARLKEINENRSPITQLLTSLGKRFTGQEARIDKATSDSPAAKLQKLRDAFAKAKAEEAERVRQANMRREAKAKEEGTYESHILVHLTNFVTDQIAERKRKMQAYFDDSKLDDIDGRREELKNASFNAITIDKWVPSIPVIYLTTDEAKIINQRVIDNNTDKLNLQYKESLDLFRNQLVDQIETKRQYLLDLQKAAADEKERKRLQAEENERQQLALKKQQEEAEQMKLNAQKQGQNIAAAAQTQAMFQSSMATQMVTKAPDKPTHYDIIFQGHPFHGYMLVLNAWMQEVGIKMTTDELDKAKFITAKKWACDKRLKDGFIIESEYLRYEPQYRAK